MTLTLIYGWQHGWVTLGDFSLVSMLSFTVLGMVWYMSYQMTVFVREMGTIKQALSLITASHGITDANDAVPLRIAKGEICFDNVTFLYRKSKKILKNYLSRYRRVKKLGSWVSQVQENPHS